MKNLPPTRFYIRLLGHVANSHEQKLTSTCCLSVKMTDKMFFFSSCLCDNTSSSRLSPVRIEILTWESWNPDIFLTSRAKDRVHYASVNKARLCPWALRLLDIMKTSWASGWGLGHLSMTGSWIKIAVSEQGPKMAKILRPRLSEMREIFTAFVLANANALWLFEWCSKDSKWVN